MPDVSDITQRTALLAVAALATIACAPGEIERRLTERPTMTVCPAVGVLPVLVCDDTLDWKQECRMELRPAPCDPPAAIVTTICLPSEAAKEGVQK